jgi:uncharacterized protein (TIGR02996 family)
MTEQAALLAAIRDNPDDDTPRLVYADWLQENGEDDRAEFIRVECEQYGTRNNRRWDRLAERGEQILKKHRKAWLGPLARRGVVKSYFFHRGFVTLLELSAAQFARHAKYVFAHHPAIDDVFLTAGGPWKACFSRPEWRLVRTLRVEDDIVTRVALRRLVESPHTTGLRDVCFGFNTIGTAGALILRDWDHLPDLEHLSLLDCDIGDRGAEAILNALRGSHLKTLNLGGNELSDVAAVHIEYADLPGLTELYLFNNWITGQGVKFLPKSDWTARLTVLNLHSNPIDDAGADALAASRRLNKLQDLKLMNCGIGRRREAPPRPVRPRRGHPASPVRFAMSDRDALLAAICAEPEDDTPRLAYADWLDENAASDADSARAEFIRVQCEEARLEGDINPESVAQRKLLYARAEKLKNRYGEAWDEELSKTAGLLNIWNWTYLFQRGFPTDVAAPAERWIAEGGTFFRVAPITDIHAYQVTPENLVPLLACPWLRCVRSLSLLGADSETPFSDWQALADCPHLHSLQSLTLADGELSRDGGCRLATANPCPQLREFQMTGVPSGDAGIIGLFGGQTFGRLEELVLQCDLSTDGAEVIARSDSLSRVTHLWLGEQPLTPESVRAITGGRFWSKLRRLSLERCRLDDADAATLAASGPTQIRQLDLGYNLLSSIGIEALASSPLLASIEVLDLGKNSFGDDGVHALVRSPHLGNLRRLQLWDSDIGPDGARALAECPSLVRLSWLGLHGNSIQATGAKAIADSPYLVGLDELLLPNIRGKTRQQLKKRFGDRVSFSS